MATQQPQGAFVATSDIFDTQRLYEVEVGSLEFKELIANLQRRTNDIALVLNIKDSGYYALEEFNTGQILFPDPASLATSAQEPVFRPIIRKVINFGSLPNATTKSVAHGITFNANTSFVKIYGAATDPSTSYIPLPYAHPTDANNIAVDVDGTNVTITTGSNRTGYTTSYVVLEYIQG